MRVDKKSSLIKQNLLGLIVLACFFTLAATASTAQAQVLYDEAVSGDVGDEAGPFNLGPLSPGTYTIKGSLCFGGDCGSFDPGDAYCFGIPEGSEVLSGEIVLSNVVGLGASTRIRSWDDTCTLTGTTEDLGNVGAGTTPLTLVPYPGGTHYGPGNFFQQGTVSGDSYDYEWTFVVRSLSEPNAIPTINTTMMLVLITLIGFVGFVYRRKRLIAHG